ncbi:MAG TPA: hypothetical protein VGG28_03530 [Kofleriaceae bacterium]|jgi:hypothetical protein
MKIVAVLSGVLFSASLSCTKHVDGCDSNTDCTNPAYPFCDVNGAYPPSDGTKNICTIVPPDCPVDQCGCQPGAASCGSDQIVTCNADGSSETTTSCALGCGSDGLTCASFTPSNGLGPILTQAGSAADFVVPTGATIDTTTCQISMSGATILSGSLVAQSAGKICAFAALDFTIGDVSASGLYPLAFVAASDITVSGVLDAGGKNTTQGPGAQPIGSQCDGGEVYSTKCNAGEVPQALVCSEGAGGGGGATAGGSGATDTYIATVASNPGSTSGGAIVAAQFSPLMGGCSGGSGSDTITNPQGTILGFVSDPGGAGGGAVQLVSGTSIELVGIVNVGGGGGAAIGSAIGSDGATVYYDYQSTGGGAGGAVVIETPALTIGPGGGYAANGGGGAGCGVSGTDGTPDATPAPGGTSGALACQTTGLLLVGGTGGTASVLPAILDYEARAANTTNQDLFGAGGGSVGSVRIATRTGSFTAGASIQSAITTAEALVTN